MTISSSNPSNRVSPLATDREPLGHAGIRAVREAILGLARAPRYCVPAILSLALGLGASTAVFAVFSALVLRQLPFPEEERLVRVGFPGASPVLEPDVLSLSAPFLRDYQQLKSIFEEVGTERSWSGFLEIGGRSRQVATQLAALSFFDTLGIQALEGRLFSAHGPIPDGLNVIVLREGFWRNELGGEPLVGTTVRYEGRPVTVVGIVRDEQAIQSFGDLWIPEDQSNQTHRTQFMARGIARLARGVSAEAAQARLTEVSRDAGVRTSNGTPVSARLMPLRDSLVQPQRAWVALMLAAVVAFLLVTTANLAVLLATRSMVRAQEWAVRRALGANAVALARSSALDAGLVGLLGAGLGLFIAQVALDLANLLYRGSFANTPARLDAYVLVAYGVAGLGCTLAGALTPVLSMRRVHPADVLRGEGRSTDTPRARRLRESLLVLQVAMTTVLLINAGLLLRSVDALLAVNTGFESQNVVTAGVLLPFESVVPSPSPGVAQRMNRAERAHQVLRQAHAARERLLRIPGAEHATVTIDVPFDYHNWPARLELPPEAAQKEIVAICHFVGPGFFETLGVRVASGSDFGASFVTDDRPVAMVSRSFARALGVSDAVGQRFRVILPGPPSATPEPWTEIIGMVEDTIENDLSAPPPLHVYYPFADGALSTASPMAAGFFVAVRGSDPNALARQLPGVLAEALPQSTTNQVRRLDEWIADSFWQRTALSYVLSALAIASVVLSAIGLFGIASFAVTQRTAEVGIRRALGATRRSVVGLVLRDTARVVLLGVAFGAVLSWFARQLLGGFLFGIVALDAVTYGVVCAGITLLALLSALAPALRASTVNPARALTGL